MASSGSAHGEPSLGADSELTEEEVAQLVESSSAGDDHGADEAGSADAGEEKLSTKTLLKELHKNSGGTNVIRESVATLSSADGVVKKGDTLLPASDMPACLRELKKMVEVATADVKKSKKDQRWAFRKLVYEPMGKTLDETFEAFLKWARVSPDADEQDDGDKGDGGDGGMVNIHKAFRRLEAYAGWMEENGDELIATPLTATSVAPTLAIWGMRFSYSKDGPLVWWIDVATLDVNAIKNEVPLGDSLRAFVWFAHVAMYDERAQRHGLAMCENLASMGFVSAMTTIPMKLSVKLDRLTIGVIPVKFKVALILDSPRWMVILMRIFSVFMSKKMIKRVKVHKKEWHAPVALFGLENVPKGFGECGGTLEGDPVVEPYLAREGIGAMAIS